MASMSGVQTSIATSDPHPNPSKINLGLDISHLVLSALIPAAKLAKIPYLQDAAQLALNIVTIIQVPRYFSISPSPITDQEREDIGSQE